MNKLSAMISEIKIKNFIKNHKTFVINAFLLVIAMGFAQYFISYLENNHRILSAYVASPLIFMVSILTWRGLDYWWNLYISKDQFMYPYEKVIKKIDYHKAFYFFVIIQSFWIIYWYKNWLLLFVIAVICFYVAGFYRTNHPQEDTINYKNDKNIQTIFSTISSEKKTLSKLKLIHFDLPSVCKFKRLWLINSILYILFFLLPYGIHDSLDSRKLDRPLTNFFILNPNYSNDIPNITDHTVITIKNVPVETYFYSSGRGHDAGLRINIQGSDNFSFALPMKYFKNVVQSFREKNTSTINYEADVWIDVRTNSLLQIESVDNSFQLLYQDVFYSWLIWQHALQNQFLLGGLCILLIILFDYFWFFYLRRYYSGEGKN